MSQTLPDFSSLNNENYLEWKDNMTSWLQSLGLWRIVSGAKLAPTNPGELEKFEDDKLKAAGFIKRKVEKGQRAHFKSVEDDPTQIWSNLEAAHLTKLPTERFNAYTHFFGITLGPDESLSSVMLRIDQAFQNILNLRPATFDLNDLDDELQSMAMIRALTPEYSSFRSSLMLQEKITRSSLATAFRVEETNRNRDTAIAAAATPIISPSANAVSSSPSSSAGAPKSASRSKPSKDTRSCTYCSKSGHDDDHCFKQAADIIAKANAAQKAPAPTVESAGNASLPISSTSGLPSPLQPNTYNNWNVDSGATAHMTPHH